MSCQKNTDLEEEEGVGPEENAYASIYIPKEFSSLDFEDKESQWSYFRSQQSEHFVLFWDHKYVDLRPDSADVPSRYRVDIDALLEQAESYYEENVGALKFTQVGSGQSQLDQYKMLIFLNYQDLWMAEGAGYDHKIGALSLSPDAARDVGVTLAREIGRAFQYQVTADFGGAAGFKQLQDAQGRSIYGDQTAQWQALQHFPDRVFTGEDFINYTQTYHLHALHPNQRFSNYFLHYYWADKHGNDFIGKLWQSSQGTEDPMQTYMRINGLSVEGLNDELYDAASKLATWDLSSFREAGTAVIGSHGYNLEMIDGGAFQVDATAAPGTTGYNVIPVNVPDAGTRVSVRFKGIANAPGFASVDATQAGWRYGFVALREDGGRTYGEMAKESEGEASMVVPEGTTRLALVVTGAPTVYTPSVNTSGQENLDQWPYQVSFVNTNLQGYIDGGENAAPVDVEFVFDLAFDYSESEYLGGQVAVDQQALSQAFVLQPSRISELIGNRISFFAIEPDGTLNPNRTANGFGQWFDANGMVTSWGSNSVLFSEFNEGGLVFHLGQYPGVALPGSTYTIKQALVYEYRSGVSVQATFVFNIKMI